MKKILLITFIISFPMIARYKTGNPDSLDAFDSKKVQGSIDLKVKKLEAKLKIINFIESDKRDSLEEFIRMCDDSLFRSPDWLINPERFFIEYYKENIHFLADPSTYENFLGLRDTIEQYNSYFAGKCLYHKPQVFDSSLSLPGINLLDYLLVKFRDRLSYMSGKYVSFNYVWDFLDFFYNEDLNTIDDFNSKSKEYYEKYPQSPFVNLVKYNFIYKKALSNWGIMFGLGLGFYDYDAKSKNFFEERGNFILYFDTYWSGISFSFNLGMCPFESRSAIFYDNKLMPKGTNFEHKVYSLSTGYIFRAHSYFYLTPYLGLTYSMVSTTSYEVKENSLDVGLPPFFGLQTGLKTDYLLNNFFESELFPAWSLILRLETGLLINNYNHLRSDLGKLSYQINLGILIAMFRPDFLYEF